MNLLKRIFNRKLTPHEFIIKFMNDSLRKHVQLELYYLNKVILQVEDLTYVPIWLNWCNVNNDEYNNGFIVHFFVEKKDIPKSYVYKNYLKNKEILNMIEFEDPNYDIVNFVKLFNKKTEALELGKYMREVIDKVYKLPGNNPQILFNLRYLKKG